MYKLNNSGPRVDPCGTPVLQALDYSSTLLIQTHWLQSDRFLHTLQSKEWIMFWIGIQSHDVFLHAL